MPLNKDAASPILSEVQDVFRQFFDAPKLVISRSSAAADIEEWDSLAHVGLILAIEKRFAIRFSTQEIQAFRNVGEIIDGIISRKQASQR